MKTLAKLTNLLDEIEPETSGICIRNYEKLGAIFKFLCKGRDGKIGILNLG
jgi:hypothetical protein